MVDNMIDSIEMSTGTLCIKDAKINDGIWTSLTGCKLTTDDSVSLWPTTTTGSNVTTSGYSFTIPAQPKDKPITDYPSYITKVGLSGVYETFEMLTMDKLMSLRLNVKEYINYIEKIIVNNKAVIILWKDKSKTTAVVQGDDEFDLERGIEICIMKRLLGSSYHSLIKEGMKKYQELEEKRQREIDLKQAAKIEKEAQELKRQRTERREREDKIYIIKEGVKRAAQEIAEIELFDEDEFNRALDEFISRGCND